MIYAVNVMDAGAKSDGSMSFVGLLLAPVIQSKRLVDAEPGQVAGMAIVLECPEDRAESICQVIRTKYPEKHELRCYKSKTGKGRWTRI